jgi:hypothetical protein
LRFLFSQNPHTRKSFDIMIEHYKLHAGFYTDRATPNSFFMIQVRIDYENITTY